MKNLYVIATIVGFGLALPAFPQSNGKVAVVNLQAAIAGTKDGQNAINDLQKQFGPRKVDLDKRQSEITQLQDQLNKATTDADRVRLTREIDEKTKLMNRAREDAQADLDQERQKVMQRIGSKLMALTDKYAKDHGYTWVLDVGGQQTPVVYYAESIDITKGLIELYDASPAGAPAKPAVPPAKPPAPVK